MLSQPCQHFNFIGRHSLGWRAKLFLQRNFGFRSHLRRFWGRAGLGRPSLYREGQWVQVLDQESVRKTLDSNSKLKGLTFLPYQWPYCGGVYRVQKVMRRIVDDQGIFRAVSGTVLLEGTDCGGVSGKEGCGRFCPLMFRDEWLKPAPAPEQKLESGSPGGAMTRVRPLEDIRRTLDWRGRRDGILFMPEMARWAGMRFRVARKVETVFEYWEHSAPRRPVYILEGLYCSGDVLGPNGPCDRRCAVLWHEDWLAHDA